MVTHNSLEIVLSKIFYETFVGFCALLTCYYVLAAKFYGLVFGISSGTS